MIGKPSRKAVGKFYVNLFLIWKLDNTYVQMALYPYTCGRCELQAEITIAIGQI